MIRRSSKKRMGRKHTGTEEMVSHLRRWTEAGTGIEADSEQAPEDGVAVPERLGTQTLAGLPQPRPVGPGRRRDH